MSRKYPGLYLYFDWVDALERLSPDKAMQIITNLRQFAEHNIEPEGLDGPETLIQNMMLAQLKRSKQASETAEKAYSRKKEPKTAMISATLSESELDREATREEKQMWERLSQKHSPQEVSEETKQTIERARAAIRGLGIG